MSLEKIRESTRRRDWVFIQRIIEKGDRPQVSDLVTALRRGEAVPPTVQDYLADLLERRSGRPPARRAGRFAELWRLQDEDQRALGLILLVEQIRAELHAANQASTIKAALQRIHSQNPNRRTFETLETKYKKAVSLLGRETVAILRSHAR